ncbi:MAG: hypothetical protein HQ567_30040 [Candidatus Nealsonbacteria bacterium]|nr:hypothetical protein [Candidatus Nealsonbacteria bacterium]
MPIKLTCKCGQQLTAKEEFQGETLKCSECGALLAIPLVEPESPQINTKANRSDAAGQPRDTEWHDWIVLETGLSITLYSLAVATGASLLLVLMVFLATADGTVALMMATGDRGVSSVVLLFGWIALCMIGSVSCMLAGWIVCGRAPTCTNSRPLISAALFSLVLSVLVTSLSQAYQAGGSGQIGIKLCFWVSCVAGAFAYMLFAAFLDKVGSYVCKPVLRSAVITFCVMETAAVLFVTVPLLPDRMSASGMIMFFCFAAVFKLVGCGILIWLVAVVRNRVRAFVSGTSGPAA